MPLPVHILLQPADVDYEMERPKSFAGCGRNGDASKAYNAENFDLYDLTAIILKDWIVEFANELIRRNLPITYQLPSGTRSEAIDEEVVDLLYRSGCRNMNYAPESGSPDTLKAIKRK